MMQGGEIYIPKIPSMKITDMARILGPDIPHREIGIRPGEKLHEIMITIDDGRNTIELEDRYIIKPQFPFWTDTSYDGLGATPVGEDFEYTSDKNAEWLSDDDFKDLLNRI